MKTDAEKTLIEKAKEVRKNAYAPYFKIFVGAAIQAEDGSIHVGCNVENASGSAMTCAEAGAVSAAIAKGVRKFSAIAVVGYDDKLLYPCGVCLQRLSEFGKGMDVYVASTNGSVKHHNLSELLPYPTVL